MIQRTNVTGHFMNNPPGSWLSGLAVLTIMLTGMMVGAVPVLAQNEQLKVLESALQEDQAKAQALRQEAEALRRELQHLRVKMIGAARKAQDYEEELSAIEATLGSLEEAMATKTADLKRRNGQLVGTLSALQRIAVLPTEALIVAPSSPMDTIRSAMLLRVAIPEVEQRSSALRSELDDLVFLREQITQQRKTMAKAIKSLDAEQRRLADLAARKKTLQTATVVEQEAAQKRATRMALQAKDLRDLLDKIEQEARMLAKREAEKKATLKKAAEELAARTRAAQAQARQAGQPARKRPDLKEKTDPQQQAAIVTPRPAVPQSANPQLSPQRPAVLEKPSNIRPFPTAHESLVMPARGRIVVRYGQTIGDNEGAKGVTIETRGGAQIVAPFDGKVVYAGEFRSYGQILIIEHGGRYHTLLAGLGRIDAVAGQWVLAGEPVGILDNPQNGNPNLYLELRRTGQPINPLPWLATTGDKVRG